MMKSFRLYEVLGPLLCVPLALAAWRAMSEGWSIPLLAVAVPILHAYVVPGIGAGRLNMWRINSPLAPHGFRWHHGFVFGGATALLTAGIFAIFGFAPVWRVAVATGAVLLAVNWVYDVYALRAGVLEVFNQPWAECQSPWRVAGDYALWFFGLFGVIYGGGLAVASHELGRDPPALQLILAIGLLSTLTITLPSLGYVVASYLRHGHHGCRPQERPAR